MLALPVILGIGAHQSTADHPEEVPCAVIACVDLVVDGNRFNPRIQTRTFTQSDCNVREGSTIVGTRTLLRFTFTTPNLGTADLVIGNPALNPLWFEYGPCHGHYHFKEYADYRLWTPEDFAVYDALRQSDPNVQHHEILEANPDLQPVRGDKRGFCVIDLVRYQPTAPPKWISCDMQGISVGWADEYYYTLDGQFVDITGLPGGDYVLEAEVNAEHFYQESSYANNRAWRAVTI